MGGRTDGRLAHAYEPRYLGMHMTRETRKKDSFGSVKTGKVIFYQALCYINQMS